MSPTTTSSSFGLRARRGHALPCAGPTGKRILLLERAATCARKAQLEHPSSQSRGSVQHQGGLARRRRAATPPPAHHYYVGGNTKFYGRRRSSVCAARISARSSTTTASRRPGPSPTRTSSPTTRGPSSLYQRPLASARRSDGPAGERARTRTRGEPRTRASSSSPTTLVAAWARPFARPLASCSTKQNAAEEPHAHPLARPAMARTRADLTPKSDARWSAWTRRSRSTRTATLQRGAASRAC